MFVAFIMIRFLDSLIEVSLLSSDKKHVQEGHITSTALIDRLINLIVVLDGDRSLSNKLCTVVLQLLLIYALASNPIVSSRMLGILIFVGSRRLRRKYSPVDHQEGRSTLTVYCLSAENAFARKRRTE